MASPVHPRLLRCARATRVFLVAGFGVGLATAILIIVQAWLLSRAVTDVFATRSLDIAGPLIPAILGVFLARAVLVWAQNVLAVHSAAAVKTHLRAEIAAARLARPTTVETSTSTLIHLVTKGLDALDGYFAKYLPQLALAATVPFLIGAVILWADWISALIIAVTLPLIPIFMALIGWTTQKATARRLSVQTRLANHFADLVEGLPTLQAFGRAMAQRRGVGLTEDANRRETMRILYVSFLSALVLELLATLSVAIVAVTIGTRVLYGQVDFETALFVLILAPEAFLPVRQVGVHFHDSADGVAAADAAFAVIDTGDEVSTPPVLEDTDEPWVSFDSVNYHYPGTSTPVVTDFCLQLGPGEIVALAGPSGSGKSTILGLLMGFLPPTNGTVLVAGTQPAAARGKLAWVAQSPGLLTGTVADNLRLGHPEATYDQMSSVLVEVGADFDADKPVGDHGEGLSAGECRRVALARALLRIRYHGATLLVLDEPTAGLDADTEARVLEAVRRSGAGAMVVSHRTAVLKTADRVVVLGSGTEEGKSSA